MEIYDVSLQRIKEKGFEEKKYEKLSEIDVCCFEKGDITLILQYWDEYVGVEDIKEECLKIRKVLHTLHVNAWNTYYILCKGKREIQDQDLFFIERDPVGIRKYVIREEKDLNRISFLDNTSICKVDNPIRLEESIEEFDQEIQSMFNFIIKNKGDKKKLEKTEIDEMLNNLL